MSALKFEGLSPSGLARVVRVVRLAEYDEWVCRATDDNVRRPGIDYFTGDKSDAIATAKAMCGLQS